MKRLSDVLSKGLCATCRFIHAFVLQTRRWHLKTSRFRRLRTDLTE